MEHAPILLVDDDEDDLDIIRAVIQELQLARPVHYFKSGAELIDFLLKSSIPPFLIICDMNLPTETGFDIKESLANTQELRYKSVPFIFWSTAASEQQIQRAYDLPAQGFFFKPSNFYELCSTFKTILNYWQKSQHPKKMVAQAD